MTSSDVEVNLIINKLSESQYVQLSAQGKIEETELYVVNGNVVSSDLAIASKTYVDEKLQDVPSGKSEYDLATLSAQVSSITIEDTQIQAYVAFAKNQTINTVTLSDSNYPLYVYLPEQKTDGARDFLVRLEILSSVAPTVGFITQSESCDFESEDDEWATAEPGVNLYNFTETKRNSEF